MTPQLFCRAGQRVKFGDQLIMRRKPADDLVSHGLFGRHKAAPASGNDMEAELVASNGRQACQSTLARPRQCTRRRSWFTETGGTPTRLFEFQFVLNAHAEAAAHESSPYDDRDFGS